MVLTVVFVLAHELLERIVQDINSHQEFVLLNILKGYVARGDFIPRRKAQDRLKPLVSHELGG